MTGEEADKIHEKLDEARSERKAFYEGLERLDNKISDLDSSLHYVLREMTGDDGTGNPGFAQRIAKNEEFRRQVRRESGIFGAGAGISVSAIFEIIKNLFT